MNFLKDFLEGIGLIALMTIGALLAMFGIYIACWWLFDLIDWIL